MQPSGSAFTYRSEAFMTIDLSVPTPKPIAPEDGSFARHMLERIALVRAFEAKALALSKASPPLIAGSVHLCAGQEAVPLAAMAALDDRDKVIATYRGHGWALATGLDPTAIMAELCHRVGGINDGRAGSAYFMAPQQRFIGENSIVGAGVPVACGVAMAERAAGRGGVVIVSIGDGAMNQGSVHEALVFAAYRRLPVILVCENNGWSELTATHEIVRVPRLSRRAMPYGIEGVSIDGADPMAVRDAVAAAATRAREGDGPTLIECRVPRLWGHYNRDVEHYRPRADQTDAVARDPLTVLGERLIAAGLMSRAEVAQVVARADAEVETLANAALAMPVADPSTAIQHVVAKPDQSPKSTVALGEAEEMTYIGAVGAALRDELEADTSTVVYGEDVGHAGGIFGASKNLQRDFGAERVFDTPIAESAILGSAVGAALCGMKPIVEIMWADFMLVALDQLVNQAANVRYITRGRSSVPLVVRTQQGATPGSCAQHSQSLEALLAHIPGLKVALAATPQDAYDLIREASADPDPCIVIEARGLYATRAMVTRRPPQRPVGRALLHRSGCDLAIVTWGAMLHQALAAADQLAQASIDAAVLDLRWLSPLDEAALCEVVRSAGGRVLIVHEAVRTGGFGAEVSTRIAELCTPQRPWVRRVTTPDVRMPAAPHLQAVLIPNRDRIVEAATRLMADTRAAERA
jgi:2-oxoisovalerate dehydrogenase E1 component